MLWRVNVVFCPLLFLVACGSPAFMGAADGTSLRSVSTPDGVYDVGLYEKNTGTWVASFNNMIRSSPTPVVLRRQGVELIEQSSGCGVDQDSVVVDLQWASVYASVEC